MRPFTRPPAKKRKAADNATAPSKKSNGSNRASRTQRGGPSITPIGTSRSTNPSVPLDDSTPESATDATGPAGDLVDDADEGMEVYDQNVARAAVLAVLTEMRTSQGVQLSNDELREAQGLFPKVCINNIVVHLPLHVFKQYNY